MKYVVVYKVIKLCKHVFTFVKDNFDYIPDIFFYYDLVNTFIIIEKRLNKYDKITTDTLLILM